MLGRPRGQSSVASRGPRRSTDLPPVSDGFAHDGTRVGHVDGARGGC